MQEAHETADLIESLEELASEIERRGIGQVTHEQRNDLRSLYHDIRSHIIGLDQYTFYASIGNHGFALSRRDHDKFAEMIHDWTDELGLILSRARKQ